MLKCKLVSISIRLSLRRNLRSSIYFTEIAAEA
jgi:hypothetical protein